MNLPPYVCTYACPIVACGYQLSLIIASLSFSPICWRVLACGYTQTSESHNVSLRKQFQAHSSSDTIGPLGCHCRILYRDYRMHVTSGLWHSHFCFSSVYKTSRSKVFGYRLQQCLRHFHPFLLLLIWLR